MFTPWLETIDWVAVVCAPSSQAAPGAPLSIMYVDILYCAGAGQGGYTVATLALPPLT